VERSAVQRSFPGNVFRYPAVSWPRLCAFRATGSQFDINRHSAIAYLQSWPSFSQPCARISASQYVNYAGAQASPSPQSWSLRWSSPAAQQSTHSSMPPWSSRYLIAIRRAHFERGLRAHNIRNRRRHSRFGGYGKPGPQHAFWRQPPGPGNHVSRGVRAGRCYALGQYLPARRAASINPNEPYGPSRPISLAGFSLAMRSISTCVMPSFLSPSNSATRPSGCKGFPGCPMSLERMQCSAPTERIARA
jgi:hypothetical protein